MLTTAYRAPGMIRSPSSTLRVHGLAVRRNAKDAVEALPLPSNDPDARGDALLPRGEVQCFNRPAERGAQDQVGLGEPELCVLRVADLHRPNERLKTVAGIGDAAWLSGIHCDHERIPECARDVHWRDVRIRPVGEQLRPPLDRGDDSGEGRARERGLRRPALP